MENLKLNSQLIVQGTFTKKIYSFKGAMKSTSALLMKKNIQNWFDTSVSECVLNLKNINELDIVGINLLVQLKMIARRHGIRFMIQASYKKEIVETFNDTGMKEILGVTYRIENVARKVA